MASLFLASEDFSSLFPFALQLKLTKRKDNLSMECIDLIYMTNALPMVSGTLQCRVLQLRQAYQFAQNEMTN